MANQGFSIRGNGILGFIFLVLVLVGMFFIAKGIFTLLLWASPFLLVGALIINYKTILNYLKFILSLLQRNVLSGIVAIIFSFIGFPILAGVLFGKALFDRKIRRLQQAHAHQESSEYVDYEEVIKPERSQRNDGLDLPPLEKPQVEKKDNRYEKLF
jgi:predicted membrane protein